MGQCCKIFSSKQPKGQSNQTELLNKSQLSILYHTRNDKQFTYFLGVYDLLSLGQKLELLEYFDELHPNFSYQRFNDTYHQYQRQIKKLGNHVEQYHVKDSLLAKRMAIDRLNIQTYRKLNKIAPTGKPGCLVKLEIQEVLWKSAKEIGVKLIHPMNWSGKFQKWYKIQQILLGPIYIQFSVADFRQAFIHILCKDIKGQIKINIEENITNDQQVVCKIMKWKQATEQQGIAIRLQLFNEDSTQQKQKIAEMTQLYKKLLQDYGVDDQNEPSINEKEINDRLSRHRTSMSQKYRLTQNSKL